MLALINFLSKKLMISDLNMQFAPNVLFYKMTGPYFSEFTW